MGEVYRARDTRLEREVAVKVLPEHLAADPTRQQRFEREARAISSLNHPNICALFDVGREGDAAYLVMELVAGETLADRLGKGPLPPQEVVRIGIQVADALEAAHRQGIVHRDLKPGNIMLTAGGVKLLDFGLATYRTPEVERQLSRLTDLPTATAPSPLTEEGAILGTYQYMAPEQLQGKGADARSDLFALGCVLYEATSGRHPFTGRNRASLIGAILKDQPAPISTIEPMAPPALDRLVRDCLAKDPDDRLQTAHDVKLQLEWIVEGVSQVGAPAVVTGRRRSRERLTWALVGVLLVAAAAFAVGYLRRVPAERHTVRLQLTPPEGLKAIGSPRISPDGRTLVFSARDAQNISRIWIRPLAALRAWPLPGTEGAVLSDGRLSRPFWSPDSRFIAFMARGKLKKVPVAGGPAQTICDAPMGADGTWGRRGVILLDAVGGGRMCRVPAAGGFAEPAVTPHLFVAWPMFLPDGRHFLYHEQDSVIAERRLVVADLDGKEAARTLVRSDSAAVYAPQGFLLFVRNNTLLAQPFDADTLELAGDPVTLAERVTTTTGGLAEFSVSDNCALVYRSAPPNLSRLLWVDRSGSVLGEVGPPADYRNPALSPDRERLAVEIVDPANRNLDIWILDLGGGGRSRLTFDAAMDFSPIWSPDGGTIVFSSDRNGEAGVYARPSSGTGPVERIWPAADTVTPGDWSHDGRFLAATVWRDAKQSDLQLYPADGSGEPLAVTQSPFDEVQPAFSPDGRYLAYASNETGRYEVYVQDFPGPGGHWQISAEGGAEPCWGADGRTIYYRDADNQVMAVAVDTTSGFSAGAPQPLFRIDPAESSLWKPFLVSRDGSRFLVVERIANQDMVTMTVVLNWDAELKR